MEVISPEQLNAILSELFWLVGVWMFAIYILGGVLAQFIDYGSGKILDRFFVSKNDSYSLTGAMVKRLYFVVDSRHFADGREISIWLGKLKDAIDDYQNESSFSQETQQ